MGDSSLFETGWNIASPFIAAALAAFLAYHFGVRQRRHDLLLTEKLASFKSLNMVLSGIVQYCEAVAHPGDDLGPNVEALPADVPRSALMHSNALDHALSAHGVFISPAATELIYELFSRLNMAASMELSCAAATELSPDPKLYDSVGSAATKCIGMLYKELRLPS